MLLPQLYPSSLQFDVKPSLYTDTRYTPSPGKREDHRVAFLEKGQLRLFVHYRFTLA